LTVDRYLDSCDFYTIDVAEFIGKEPTPPSLDRFVASHKELVGKIEIAGFSEKIEITMDVLHKTARKFLFAVQEASRVYRHIEAERGNGTFISEISMDETDSAQTPAELLIILAAIADRHIPIQTIAPKFSGRFNKGVDYVGDTRQFELELTQDVAVIKHAIQSYGLPENLKLSIHSGSDKFSIYPAIRRVLRSSKAGVHLKTAGTTWLEEVIGLAEAGGDGLAIVKEIYAEAFRHASELCAPYATVIDIEWSSLPDPAEVFEWNSIQFVGALRHDIHSRNYNRNLRQLLHVGFKVAAKLGNRYLDLLESNEEVIAKNVTANLFARHIAPVFLGSDEI
jgi:hypothetical protein